MSRLNINALIKYIRNILIFSIDSRRLIIEETQKYIFMHINSREVFGENAKDDRNLEGKKEKSRMSKDAVLLIGMLK